MRGLGDLSLANRCDPPAEGVHRLRHQRQTAHPLHAPEQAHLPVPRLALRGVSILWVHHHGHDRPEHRRADDEGERVVAGGSWVSVTAPSQGTCVCALDTEKTLQEGEGEVGRTDGDLVFNGNRVSI